MLLLLLRSATFRKFLLSDVILGFSVGMSIISTNWYMIDITNSSQYLGILVAIQVFSGFIISPFIGVVIDKFSRKNIILLTLFARVLLISIIIIILLIDNFSIFALFFIASVNGAGWACYLIVSRSFLQEVISENELISGNSLIEISLQSGMFLAAAAAGLIYKYYGFISIQIITIFFFIASIILIKSIKDVGCNIHLSKDNHFQMLKQGFIYLHENKLIFLLGLISIVPFVVTMLYNVVLPSYVKDILVGDSVTFGLADMYYGIGGLVSGFVASLFSTRMRIIISIIFLFALSSFDLLMLSISYWKILLYFGSFILGLANSSIRIIINSLIMKLVEPSYMGRISSIYIGISLCAQTILSLYLGYIINNKNAPLGFLIMSIIMFLGLLGFIFIINKLKRYL